MATADEVLLETDDRMQRSVEALRRELNTIRTGRASPALIETLTVEYYGVPNSNESTRFHIGARSARPDDPAVGTGSQSGMWSAASLHLTSDWCRTTTAPPSGLTFLFLLRSDAENL